MAHFNEVDIKLQEIFGDEGGLDNMPEIVPCQACGGQYNVIGVSGNIYEWALHLACSDCDGRWTIYGPEIKITDNLLDQVLVTVDEVLFDVPLKALGTDLVERLLNLHQHARRLKYGQP